MLKQSSDIWTVGAYDRVNYGDLLFPLILSRAGQNMGIQPMLHCALRTVDLQEIGGPTVTGLRQALESCAPPKAIIVAGGEVLSATWSQVLMGYLPYPLDLAVRVGRRAAGRSLADSTARLALRGVWRSPYVPDLSTSRRARVVLNSVGASSVLNLARADLSGLGRTLSNAAYISVRDKSGLAALKSIGISAELAPDSAAVVGELWSVPKDRSRNTLVVQCEYDWFRRNPSFGRAVADASRRFEDVVLLPIGLAGGHSDQVALRHVARALDRSHIRYRWVETSTDISKISTTISNASMFVGTSLHGAITALAHATPSVALGGIGKLSAYVSTWAEGLVPRDVAPDRLESALDCAPRMPALLVEGGSGLGV
ncbi:polysaccharide pyruvyl transferase family protein, partial [Ilumatobacter sp.]|uniref:polysaccharide pyruvyl transferase family protein n=1 Tax=Ilumatobacter sp. TaxID=1967498 RepID=UPI00375010A6